MTLPEVAFRLGIATAIGAALGLNREMRDKPAGLKTLALVGLGSAFAPVMMLAGPVDPGPDALSRVLQGVLTGIGFVGAGVILHRETLGMVRGLTTAAVVWVVAGLGFASGLGLHWPALIGAAIALLVLTLGQRVERTVRPNGHSTED